MLVWALTLALVQDPEPPDPKVEIPHLLKALESKEAEDRKQALEGLLGYGEQAKSRTLSALRRLKANELRNYKNARRTFHQKLASGRDSAKIDSLRKEALSLLQQKQNEQMRPVVEKLLELYYPDMKTADSDPKVSEAAARLVEIEGMIGRWEEKTEDVRAVLAKAAEDMDQIGFYLLVPAQDAGTLERNRKMQKDVEPQEYKFTVILNRYRIALDKGALEIDVKLCKAARGHSKDMKEKNFFSHDSPVPGKQTPQMRAAAEGTGCFSENITRAGTTPEEAFWSWFKSTAGHHENMIGGAGRIGIGNFQEMWTANF